MKPCLSTLFDQYDGLWGVFTVKQRHNFTHRLTYRVMPVCKYSHIRTCLCAMCGHLISICFMTSVVFPRKYLGSALSCSCACSHTKRRVCAHFFWLTNLWLCVTLNISHLVCHIISHRCSRNKVPRHDFLTYEPSHYATFDLQGRLRVQIFTYEDVSVCIVSQNF